MNKLIGNKNAVKGDQAATSFIHARCQQTDKSRWINAAQLKKLKLTEWIIETLNNQTKKI